MDFCSSGSRICRDIFVQDNASRARGCSVWRGTEGFVGFVVWWVRAFRALAMTGNDHDVPVHLLLFLVLWMEEVTQCLILLPRFFGEVFRAHRFRVAPQFSAIP